MFFKSGSTINIVHVCQCGHRFTTKNALFYIFVKLTFSNIGGILHFTELALHIPELTDDPQTHVSIGGQDRVGVDLTVRPT